MSVPGLRLCSDIVADGFEELHRAVKSTCTGPPWRFACAGAVACVGVWIGRGWWCVRAWVLVGVGVYVCDVLLCEV